MLIVKTASAKVDSALVDSVLGQGATAKMDAFSKDMAETVRKHDRNNRLEKCIMVGSLGLLGALTLKAGKDIYDRRKKMKEGKRVY